MVEEICVSCGTPLHKGRKKNYEECLLCHQDVCLECSKLGICPTHYAALFLDQIEDLKKANRTFRFLADFGIILVLFSVFTLIWDYYFTIACGILSYSYFRVFYIYKKRKTDGILFDNKFPSP